MVYLLDTDILIDFSRRLERAADYLDSLGDWSLSIVSGIELVAGAQDKGEVKEIDIMLAAYRAAPISAEVGQLAYNLMKTHSKVSGLEPCDALIAATALYEGLKLSAKNDKHFRSISELDMEVPDY